MFLLPETQFGLNFLNTLPCHNESLVFSPISIALVLSLLHSGSRGKTREQIGDALLNGASDAQFLNHYSSANEEILSGKKTLIQESIWEPTKKNYMNHVLKEKLVGVEVNLANRIYLKEGISINSSYLTNIGQYYKAQAKNLPSSTVDAVQEINNFVNESTKGNIQNIATEDLVEHSIALLINAIYFKGDWKNKFERTYVRSGDFTTFNGEVTSKRYMIDFAFDDDYSSDDIFEVVHLKYFDERFELAIFLPKQRNTLKHELGKLDAKRFQNLMTNRSKKLLNIQIPKFKIETSVSSLKTNLGKLGVTEVFSESADLSAIAENLSVTDGLHKAMIEVDEDGTKAAAVTMVMLDESTGGELDPTYFIADHPFLFALAFENHPLFIGVLNK
ncbi:hypothetical protein CAEBREN_00029 [Caenorhabditis brenneri]|uniref:Serpin domain-containing protein n=1 Tax=Caenorhabditis brenneri TaxID=135651 RepID=G0NEJ0_CAEBE|nr:hypothetical protein CAEBREN_00029 [Caenorhabditis brenneri]